MKVECRNPRCKWNGKPREVRYQAVGEDLVGTPFDIKCTCGHGVYHLPDKPDEPEPEKTVQTYAWTEYDRD